MKKTNDILLFCVLILLQAGLIGLYVLSERNFPFWDQDMYVQMARSLAMAPGFAQKLDLFTASFARNYNFLFALPSLLSFSLFGASRGVFILTNFFAFSVPFQIAAGLCAARLFSLETPRALWIAGLTSLAVLPFWTPLLEAFPDPASAALFAFAVFVLLAFQDSFKKAALIGALLAFAIVLRRHFAYAGIAFFAAWGLEALWRKKPIVPLFRFLCVAGGVCAALVALMEPAYVHEVMTTSFRDLYRSYEEPFGTFLVYIASQFGVPSLVLAGCGFAWALKCAERWADVRFVALFAFLWTTLWGAGPGQLGIHHLMPILPLFVLLGFVALWIALWPKKPLVVLFALFLIAQAAWGFAFSPSVLRTIEPTPPSFFAETHAPLRRADYDSLIDLARFLDRATTPQDRIVVVGSSTVLNQDLLRAVIMNELHRPDLLMRVFWAPEIDHNQAPPFDVVAGGTFFIVPSPAQYHLNPEGQTVVTALARQFPPAPNDNAFFEQLPDRFTLEHGVTLSFWKRKAWTPEMMHRKLELVRSLAGGTQRWVVPDAAFQPTIQTNPQGMAAALLPFDPSRPSAKMFFDVPLSLGNYRLGTMLWGGTACGLPTMTISLLRGNGERTWAESLPVFTIPTPLYKDFRVGDEGAFLTIEIQGAPQGPCNLGLQDLRVEKIGA